MKTYLDININFKKFVNLEDNSDWTTDMPYYWICFFKIDGNKCELDFNLNLTGKSEVFSNMDNFKSIINCKHNLNDEIILPQTAQSNTIKLKPIKVPNYLTNNGISEFSPYVGCITIFCNDEIPETIKISEILQNHIQKSFNELIPFISSSKNNLLKFLNILKKDIEKLTNKTYKKNQPVWNRILFDFQTDASIWFFSSDELQYHKNVSLIKYWGIDGLWKLEGNITILPTKFHENKYEKNSNKEFIDPYNIAINA